MKLLEQKLWFDSPEFEEKYHCDAPLGAYCGPDGTIFRLWAPTASRVELNLYPAGNDCAASRTVPMRPVTRGVWTFKTDEDLDGTYYDFDVTVDGVTRRTADPYAVACGVNGERSMVLDLRRTDPEGWGRDAAPKKDTEQIIYELHVRDFSWDRSGGFEERDRGRYTALCRAGTTLEHDGEHPTGLDYLKRLGVTDIQLMPVYDFGSVDERKPEASYNWGYDPVNYNVPEGSYSSDPYHGEVRVRELKQAIQTLHQNGFRVIMDVVYNHTYHLESWLWRTAPWYHYRQNEDGTAANGSGCGSELATERSMCARYILDSVLYWAREYHMDGFRFDLMGLLDVELMNRIQKALDEEFGVGEKHLYGEPWGASASAARSGTQMCHKDNLGRLDGAVGAFCDNTRDAVKGDLMGEKSRGFVNGGYVSPEYLRCCVTGWTAGSGPFQTPEQTITYLSCHDDWTLWDKLVFTLSPRRRFTARSPKVLRANRLAAAINFCCQGYPFFLAGEEFGRTKWGVKNSYNADSAINQLDWTRAWTNHKLVDYYRGLIALRKKLPCLCDKSDRARTRVRSAVELAHGCVGISMDNRGAGSKWDKVLLIFHTGETGVEVPLPGGEWQVLADGRSSFRWKQRSCIREKAALEPVSALILGRISK